MLPGLKQRPVYDHMNRVRTRRLFGGFALGIFLVLLVGASSFVALRNQTHDEEWLKHTYKVLNNVNYIEQLTIDMETGRRGFRCTGDTTFLQPYYTSQPKVAPAIEVLEASVADNPVQSNKVHELEESLETIDSLWKSINIHTIYHDDSEKYKITIAERKYMDRVRAAITDVRDTEGKLLTLREANEEKAVSQATWVLIIGITLVLIIVGRLIWVILQELKSRIRAEDILQEKIAEVEKVNENTLKANWLLEGIKEINGSLIGHDNVQSLLQACLTRMADYMDAPAGAFYFYDPETQLLEQKGRRALPGNKPVQLALGEGIVGDTASQHEIKVIDKIPADYWKITSTLGAQLPDTIICTPLWQKNELKGVIELAVNGTHTGRDMQLLAAVTNNIAVAISGAYSREQGDVLLHKVQEQKEELESQQEELRQTNEELSHQTEVLQESEEQLKAQEGELRQVNVELEEKSEAIELARRALAQKATELEASNKYKSEFLANMSHELRTPLNSVLILANLLSGDKATNLTGKQKEYARIIHKSGSDLLNLINDILDLSKIEAGKVEMIMEHVSPADIAQDIDQLLREQANDKHINFRITLADDLPATVVTDRQRLAQVIRNLLSNAFKFTPQQGDVELKFTVNNNMLSVAVSDTGIGIAQEKQQLIFEAFQQADGSTSRRFGGTGLGLSISKELVKRLNGTISLVSTPGAGSTFTVTIPVEGQVGIVHTHELPGHMPQEVTGVDLDHVQPQQVIGDDKANLSPGQQSVLIIEDDTHFAGILVDFARSKGYKTIAAITGEEGLLYASEYRPAAIILDLGLPGINGRNVLRLLKSDPGLKNIPVHVISSEDRGLQLPDNIESYFQKPMDTHDLERTFEDIGNNISAKYKNILILSADSSDIRLALRDLAMRRNTAMTYESAADLDEATTLLSQKSYDCIVADIGKDTAAGIAALQQLKEQAPGIYVITCIAGDVSGEAEKQISRLSDSVIRRSGQSMGRLFDEVELFLHKIKQPSRTAPHSSKGIITDDILRGKTVLLADDDMRNIFALSAIMEEAGMKVVAAENGKEAVALLASHPEVNIVLTDIMMPEMDGYEAIRLIRKKPYGKDLPIIALTAKAMTGDREKCIEAGASDYITKPVDNNKLFSLMRVWLSTGGA